MRGKETTRLPGKTEARLEVGYCGGVRYGEFPPVPENANGT